MEAADSTASYENQRQVERRQSVGSQQVRGAHVEHSAVVVSARRSSTRVDSAVTETVPRMAPLSNPITVVSSTVRKSGMANFTALDFAAAARCLRLAAQHQGLNPPLFRSPPEGPGLSRSLRRNQDGSATIAVAVRGRFSLSVLADMVDGVVVANSLAADTAAQIRDVLWLALAAEPDLLRSASGTPPGSALERPSVEIDPHVDAPSARAAA